MKKILRVHTYDPSTEDEQHYLLRNIRRSVAAVGVDCGIEKLNSMSLLNTICGEVFEYLLLLGAETKTVCGMKKRAKANFVDVLHALELMDKQMYDEVLNSNHIPFVPAPETSDQSVIERYGDIHLDRQRYHGGNDVVGFTNAGEPISENKLNDYEYIKCGTSFLELASGRAISVLDKSRFASSPIPYFKFDDFLTNPKVLLPLQPDKVENLQSILKEHGHKKEVTDQLNQPLYQALLTSVSQLTDKPGMEVRVSVDDQAYGLGPVGKILRPYRYTAQASVMKTLSEQFDTLLSDSDPYIFNIKSLPINIPSQLEWWMPVYPLGDEAKPSDQTAPADTAVSDQQNDKEKVELQIELCNIEPDFPTLEETNRSAD